MKREFLIFVGIIVVVFGAHFFGASLNYSTVMNSEVKAATYFLDNQSTNGAFQIPPYMKKIPPIQGPNTPKGLSVVPNSSIITEPLFGETARILRILYELGVPMDTNKFGKAVNFVTEPSTYTTVSGIPIIREPQFQMLSDFLWIQNIFGVRLSKCDNLARNVIVDNYLRYAYEPLKYVTILEMPPYKKYQKLQLRYFALKIINILPFVETKKLFDLAATNSEISPSGKEQTQLANALTSMYVVLEKYLMDSYIGNGKWLPQISNPHGGTVGVTVEALYYLSRLENVIFNTLGKKLNTENGILKDMNEYRIKRLKNTDPVKESIKFITSMQASDGSWGGVMKPLPAPTITTTGKTKMTRFYYEPGVGKIFITSEAVAALLRMGVPATNSSIKKAIEFLMNSQSKMGYWKSKLYTWSDVTTAAMITLREYAKYRWNKEINISKELPLAYLKKRKIDLSELSQRLGTLYLGILNRLVSISYRKIQN